MAVKPTRLSRLSVGWKDSARSLVDYDAGDTGTVFSVTGPSAQVGAFAVTGAITGSSTLSVDGAVTALSTMTVAGQVTATGGIAVGGGTNVVAISTSTHEDDLGTIAANDSSVITVGHSGATRGDTFIITRDSEFSVADDDVVIYAFSGNTTGEVNVVAVNSTITAVDTTVGVFRLTRINFGSYI